MPVILRQLAEWVGGEVVGDADTPIDAARPLSDAQAGDITFAEDDRHIEQMHHCPAAAAVVPLKTTLTVKPLIRVGDPLMAFAQIAQRLKGPPPPPPTGVHPLACVHPTATIGHDVCIDPFAVIGPGCVIGARCRIGSGVNLGSNCHLGDDVTLHPNVVLYAGCILGRSVIVHSNTVIGADGFGYRPHDGRQVKVPQLGHVEIGDDVEIGACTTIDRGTFGPTRIGAGTKIDNLVQIAHNCQVGQHNLFVSQVGIAGSSSAGDHVVIAGQSGIADHIHIGARAIIGAMAGVHKNVPDGAAMLGIPATPIIEQKRILKTLEKLPKMRQELMQIKKALRLPDEPADDATT